MILTGPKIREEIENGSICVEPFDPKLISINSIDFRLGSDFFKVRYPSNHSDLVINSYGDSKEEFERIPLLTKDKIEKGFDNLDGRGKGRLIRDIPDDVQFILMEPRSFVLGRTLEKIGTSSSSRLVPDIHAKSTTGRWGLTVALCAGKGDIGYKTHWTLEIHNNTDKYRILCVGTVIGQISFYRTEGEIKETYGGEDRYQLDADSPDSFRILPKALKLMR